METFRLTEYIWYSISVNIHTVLYISVNISILIVLIHKIVFCGDLYYTNSSEDE